MPLNKFNRLVARVPIRKMSEPSNFEARLNEEIIMAKKIQEKKHKKRKVTDKKLRDSNGFKMRINDSLTKKKEKNDPDYKVKIENNLRKIEPYYFTYKTFCKLRWRDKKLLDVFTSEFRDRSKEYYKEAIENGSVYLDDQPATIDSVIRNGQLITHKLHRHEPPITAKPVKIVYQDDDILVIDKPSGIPVHPTGRYRFNTVTKMLERELGCTVHPCNRLDKQTSGLMFLAKTPKGADKMGDQLKAREVSKQYIARVVGEFPVEEVTIDKPLKTLEPRVALNVVCEDNDPDGKHSKTIFKRISYDGKTSIITCKPLTGRQHQIRVHLQYLGYPIANDPIYSNPHIWGPNLGKNGEADYDHVIKELYKVGRTRAAQSWYYPNAHGESLKDEKCSLCKTDLFTDPDPEDLILWLHAYKYESNVHDETTGEKKWSYRTEFPDWALEPHKKILGISNRRSQKM